MTLARPIAAIATAALILLTGCTKPDNTTADTAPSSTPSPSSTPPLTTPSPLPSPSSTPTAPTPTATLSATAAPTPTPAAPEADVTVTVVLKDGKVTPNGENVRVKDGQKVQISLDSDVAESIHVHGYDKTVDVKPGGTDEVTFAADQKGVFEVETHETAKLVVKLIVS